LGGAPAGILLVVGGPGSGKGHLSKRLEKECGVVHLSSGDLLRDEVRRDTVLGRQVQDIMAKGELVSSAVIVTLMRRVMRNHPGKRVLLDGFPRSLQNAHDLVELCGRPQLALHLECDDTILMERILKRSGEGGTQRDDDNIHTALKRLRTYHKFHNSTMEWLREQHVPIVNLDCSGTPESVWEQLSAIGRLMRPAVKMGNSVILPFPTASAKSKNNDDDSAAA
jgi:adenylate kinase